MSGMSKEELLEIRVLGLKQRVKSSTNELDFADNRIRDNLYSIIDSVINTDKKLDINKEEQEEQEFYLNDFFKKEKDKILSTSKKLQGSKTSTLLRVFEKTARSPRLKSQYNKLINPDYSKSVFEVANEYMIKHGVSLRKAYQDIEKMPIKQIDNKLFDNYQENKEELMKATYKELKQSFKKLKIETKELEKISYTLF